MFSLWMFLLNWIILMVICKIPTHWADVIAHLLFIFVTQPWSEVYHEIEITSVWLKTTFSRS